ncbi:MAG: hypothetical protein JSU65_10850 [Candidatus Zixiibacteriota bacterium]|nr:MAG: hypothetical protein JSU65_10850 [candidate division Zixibacteria bacterium]
MNSPLLKIPLILGLLSFPSMAGVLPLGPPEHSLVYDRLERIGVLSLDQYDYQIGPYRFDHAPFVFGPLERFEADSPSEIGLFAFTREDFRAAERTRAVGYEQLRAGLTGEPVENLFLYGSFVLDEELAEDEGYHGKRWRGLAGDVQQAFAHLQGGKINLTFGRFASFWGIRNSLIFSGSQYMDGFGYTFRWGKLAVSYRLARLDGLSPDIDSVAQYENRYLAAHRFDYHFGARLRLGVFETVVFGGPGRQIDLFYLNPLLFYHGTQLNEGTNDNIMIGLDFEVKPKSGLKLYGQLLVDDIQVDNKTQGDQEPDEYGLVLGMYAADLAEWLDLKAEYSRVTNWTFNQMLPRNRYINNGRLIGSAPGNDYDLLSLCLIRWLGDFTATDLQFEYYRQGEGRVGAEWTAPWTQVTGDYTEPFPTGTVEKTATVAAGFRSFIRNHVFISLESGISRIHDFSHVSDDNRTITFLNLQLSAFLIGSTRVD